MNPNKLHFCTDYSIDQIFHYFWVVSESNQDLEISLRLIEDPTSTEYCSVEKTSPKPWQHFQRGWKLCGELELLTHQLCSDFHQ